MDLEFVKEKVLPLQHRAQVLAVLVHLALVLLADDRKTKKFFNNAKFKKGNGLSKDKPLPFSFYKKKNILRSLQEFGSGLENSYKKGGKVNVYVKEKRVC